MAGSRETLIAHVNGGGRVRIGWQLDWNVDGHIDVSHWSDGSFLTVFEGEVFAQFNDIHRQIPLPGTGEIALAEGEQAARWTGKLGSDGVLEGIFYGGSAHRWSVASRWCDAESGAPRPNHAEPRPASCDARWRERFRNTSDGATERGDRRALVDALRRGDPLRVAWGSTYADGTYTMEHVAEPVFFSIVGGDHVVAQLPEHIGQITYVRLDDARFGADPQVMWRGLLRTDGLFDAVWVDRGDGQVVRRLPQRAAVSWLTHSTPAQTDCARSPALQLAVPNGVVPDSTRQGERVPR
ncbi:MAG: hypothetical protein AAGA68_14445 [Pseudomonadota bacterium]